MTRNIQLTTGMSNIIQEGITSRRDSDFRSDQRDTMGQMGTFEYYRGHKVALEHTAKVLLDAIPKVYDSERKIRTVDEANQSSEVAINEKNTATGEILNDLTMGKYDITVEIGPTFKSRRTEANSKIIELGAIDPTVVQRNMDIIASNIDAPGMNLVSDRERANLFKQGQIPQDQWTDEEKEQAQQAQESQQNQPPDPATVIAQAEAQKAENDAKTSQFKALEAQAKLEQAQNKQDFDQSMQIFQAEQKQASQAITDLSLMVKTLVDLNSLDAPKIEAEQKQLINDSQQQLDNATQ